MSSHPLYTLAEAQSRETFLSLMWALSYPGRVYPLPENIAPLEAISAALLDLETSFYTNDASFVTLFERNGARALSPSDAAYHFYPRMNAADLDSVKQANVGTLLYPDRSATLIIGGCTFDQGQSVTLTGAGINGTINLKIDGLPPEFWTLRDQRRRFPLGWDVFFLEGSRVIGLPRSTMITR